MPLTTLEFDFNFSTSEYINIWKMSVDLKDFLTVSVKPHQIQIDIMNNNSFFELCFMVTAI